MRIHPVAMLEVGMVVGYLMHVGDQKEIRIEVVIEGDAHVALVTAAGEVAYFGLPVFSKLELERRILPEGQAVGLCGLRNVCLKNALYFLYRHCMRAVPGLGGGYNRPG